MTSSFFLEVCSAACITEFMFRSVHAAKTASRKLREGAGAIPRNFGRLKAAQSGVAPALQTFWPRACFTFLLAVSAVA